ncbi:MAG TPA: ribonuclease Z [Saprospiraceae bacterium]|nr:ribonuclease Z [Saprospiraceae bacterium]HRN34499.1 ribonuclease Z [Saprospiraceae bacterium]HRP83551.1 ribonuclease Z [Saprospiraceae bacterium]
MSFNVTILGSNSALPAHGRHPSSQLLTIDHHEILMDCGEGTIFRLNDLKLSKMKIEAIFISHLHGDHVYGLPGLVTSLILMGRKDPLTIIGPIGIKKMMEHVLESSWTRLNYPLEFIETNPEKQEIVFYTPAYTVETIPLKHKIPCNGYLFRQQQKPKNIREEIVLAYQLNPLQIKNLKSGMVVDTPQGTLHPEDVLYVKHTAKSYAYCSDTVYLPSIIPIIKDVDLLYHEATYLDDFEEKAKERGHSTARQAGMLARQAGVKKLLLGHPSSKYANIEALVKEAQNEFQNTKYATEGLTFEV